MSITFHHNGCNSKKHIIKYEITDIDNDLSVLQNKLCDFFKCKDILFFHGCNLDVTLNPESAKLNTIDDIKKQEHVHFFTYEYINQTVDYTY